MRNQQIRLTESDLHFIVEESVRNILIQEGLLGNVWNGVKNVAGGVADAVKGAANGAKSMYYNGQAEGQIQKLNQMKTQYEQMQQQYQQKIEQIVQQIQQLQGKANTSLDNMNNNISNFNNRFKNKDYTVPDISGDTQQPPQQTQQQQ